MIGPTPPGSPAATGPLPGCKAARRRWARSCPRRPAAGGAASQHATCDGTPLPSSDKIVSHALLAVYVPVMFDWFVGGSAVRHAASPRTSAARNVGPNIPEPIPATASRRPAGGAARPRSRPLLAPRTPFVRNAQKAQSASRERHPCPRPPALAGKAFVRTRHRPSPPLPRAFVRNAPKPRRRPSNPRDARPVEPPCPAERPKGICPNRSGAAEPTQPAVAATRPVPIRRALP